MRPLRIRRPGKSIIHDIRKVLRDKELRRQGYYYLLRRVGVRFVQVRVREMRMWVDLCDEVLGYYLFIHQEYEPFETSLVERITQTGMMAVDIGANIGYYTMILSSRVGPKGRVIAFEPDPTNMYLLRRNVRCNDLLNVICEQAAVLGFDGKTTLYLSNSNFGDHRVFDAQDEDRFNKGVPRKSLEARAISLDNYLQSIGHQANIIKMDIQGAEMLALPGMMQALSNPNITFFCEFWPYGLRKANSNPKQYLLSLRELGLDLFEIVESDQRIVPVDIDELSERFPDLGLTNLVCFHSTCTRSKL
ncbi:MAG: FkbM family methyltransferase [Chloroflexi bacterium]|nr:FkbM family methyltransferase [Chloroflexota bacterium]